MRVLLDGKSLARGYRPRAEAYTMRVSGGFMEVPNGGRPSIRQYEEQLERVTTPALHKPDGSWRLIPYAIWTARLHLYYERLSFLATESQVNQLMSRGNSSSGIPFEWEFSWDSNEGCVLLDTVDICRLLKLDPEGILGEDYEHIDQFYDHFRARKPKASEASLVADALEDINFHSICGRLREAIDGRSEVRP